MGKKKFNISSKLYGVSRDIGRLAGKLNDIETLTTGDPSKIINRQLRKKTFKASNGVTRKINSKFFK